MNDAAILLVEDDPADVGLIQSTLKRAGLDNPVYVVSDADLAIAYLEGTGEYADRATHPLPAVIFIDLKLPGKSGHYVLEWMAQHESLRGIVRIVLTGSDDPADLKKANELGANAYMRKPLTVEQITGPGKNLQAFLSQQSAITTAPQ
jgi:CheY-like chemotaxis protein